jgi:hypothetical protein
VVCPPPDDDYRVQVEHWARYLDAKSLPKRLVQVDLERHRKVSQYVPQVVEAYGFNACGLVAAAAALGGAQWFPLARQIRAVSGDAYGPQTGIQPSPYARALGTVFGTEAVSEHNAWSLCDLYVALERSDTVIVDLQVGSFANERPEMPTTVPPNYAHFARVLGLDLTLETVYIENTLKGDSAYWTVPLDTFWEVWQHPETQVSIRAPNPEDVTRWAVVVRSAGNPPLAQSTGVRTNDGG